MPSLPDVVAALERIAPPALAEEWDNVGLLLSPCEPPPVRRVLLCVDFTRAVLEEAIEVDCDLVVSYHPPIFDPLRRLDATDPSDPGAFLLVRALEYEIAVYSPHTALDAAPGGVNDWLADGLPPGLRRAIRPAPAAAAELGPNAESARVGQGRIVLLEKPVRIDGLVRGLSRHLGGARPRLAAAPRHEEGERVGEVALCAGAGGEVLRDVAADLVVTGEMRHHDVLRHLARGRSVLLFEHAATERGYLPRLARRLGRLLRDVDVRVSERDRGPLG